MMTLEQAQEIRNSVNWKNVVKELNYRISCVHNRLTTCDSDELFGLQRKIQMYEEIKKLPDDVVEREQSPTASD